MKNCVDEFLALFRELRTNSNVEILKINEDLSVNNDRAAYLLENLRERYGYRAPEEFKGYFDVSEDTHLRYVYYRNNEVKGGGEFCLNFLYDTLISLQEPELWDPSMSPEAVDMLKTFRVIDDHPDSGDSKLAAFSVREGVSPPVIPDIYFYDRGDYFRMRIDYGGYLDALLGLIGVSNWQYIFCNVNLGSAEMTHIYESLNRTLADFREIFPERDFSRYQSMLDSKR